MIKRILAIVLLFSLILQLAACGKENTSSVAPSSTAALLFIQTGEMDQAAVSSEHFSFSKGEMVYLFTIVYNQYSSILSSYGVDMKKSLKEQIFTWDSSGDSWFDVFMEEAVSYAENYLLFCEASEEAGLKLDQSDEEFIAGQKKSLEDEALSYGWSIDTCLEQMYGTNISWKYVESVLKKIRLGQKSYQAELEDKVYTGEELEKEYQDNLTKYAIVDYYSVDLGDGENLPAEAVEEAREEMRQVTNLDEYKTALAHYFSRVKTAEEIETAGGIEAYVASKLSTAFRNGYPYTDTEFMRWAFSDEAKEGTVYLLENSNTQAPYANFLAQAPYRDESETKDVRHILFKLTTYNGKYATASEARAAADLVYQEWLKSGASEDRFIELCAQHSEDGNASSGGLYTDIYKGQMVQEFEDWCFDTSRKAGDSGIVDTTYGSHIVYFVGSNVSWVSEVEESLRSEAYSKLYDRLKETYPIEKKDTVLNSINW